MSQSTPTNKFYQEEEPPYSPADSTTSFISSVVAGIAEKSASELGSLLKNAYKSLREKEKNLLLAAEIGKSLLEHNQALKSDYDKLLQNVKHCEIEAKQQQEEEETMRLISSKKAYDSIIESLERKNAEIQQMLEQTQQESEFTNEAYQKKQRKLESEIEILRHDLDLAAQKVQELEELKKQQHVGQLDERRDFEQRQSEDLELLEELTVKLEELFIENKHLQLSKKSVEAKLMTSLQDLDTLKKEFEQFELTQQNYLALQEAFEQQRVHIRELNDSLEDHRLILSKLRDRGLWSPHTPSMTSKRSTSSTISTSLLYQQKSLLGELEHVWKGNGLTKSRSDTSLSQLSDTSSLSSKLYEMTERNLTSFYNAPADYAVDTLLSTLGIEDRAMLDEAEHYLTKRSEGDISLFGPEGNGTVYAELNLYPILSKQVETVNPESPKKGLVNHILFHIRYLFRSLFRWCRFAIILTAAIFINLWKGPDLLLEQPTCM
ncbi:uncharacterized protein B0P05DRAFT_578942 [Gilbertella persicaria]|uniref:uncharacterized protein n=1 Tax=Gilbertella persicaria TaxID=101096 RepID=UPI002220CCA3|nr:uncharacterized protein B0P05DRAFT_578942 [Gilbertella persicaria]KAI8080678.1 hypothetical protein B0P05DRAFT_578942 [Gilbertella persicaria]